jgi:ribosomal protein S18 acetylase RimI-like enzyme
MIRPADPSDTPTLVALARDTGFFKDHDIRALQEVLDDYHATNRAAGHLAVVLEEAGDRLGFAYYAPASMTDGTWHLWWIAVRKQRQARGHGTALLRHAEEEVKGRRGRMLLIETSSQPIYEPTRGFYLRHDYKEVARLPDYYAVNDDLVIYGKRFPA